MYNLLSESVSECYKKPSKEVFWRKVLEIFKTDLDSSSYLDVELEVIKFPQIALKEDNYILTSAYIVSYEYGNEDNKKYVIENIKSKYNKMICNYNKMIFYNDLHATNWIKANHPSFITGIVSLYGYTGNEDWLKFTFSKTDFTRAFDVEELLFQRRVIGWNYRGPKPKNPNQEVLLELRKDMLEKMIEHKVEFSQFATVADMVLSSPDSYQGDIMEIVARLYDATYRMGGYGLLEYLYDRKISYKETFKEHDYYGLEALREYSETIYKPEHERESRNPAAIVFLAEINDPDGYTNVRKGRSSSSEILFRINEGEEFTVEIEKESDEWWHVISPKYGYIHKSRVKIKKKLY
jgi:hypothetical protein